MKTIIHVEGMTCPHCVKHVTEALQGVPGVIEVSVSLEGKTAMVEHGEDVGFERLEAVITEEGYEVVRT